MTERSLRFQRSPYAIYGLISVVLVLVFLNSDIIVNIVPKYKLFIWQSVTGLVLTGLLLYQWVLLLLRILGIKVQSHLKAHRWVGVACAAVFAFHALSFGYGWTNTLAVVFCLSAITGLLNREVINYRKPWIYKLWYWSHVTLSVNLVPLIAVHIWVALAYEGY